MLEESDLLILAYTVVQLKLRSIIICIVKRTFQSLYTFHEFPNLSTRNREAIWILPDLV